MERKFTEVELKEKFVSLLKSTGMKKEQILAKLDTIPIAEIETLINNLSDQIAGFEKESKRKEKLAMIDATLKVLKIEENRLLADREKVQAE